MYTRRSVLASAAGVAAAAVLSGCDPVTAMSSSSAPSSEVTVDFGQTEYFPLLKSKIGVARALDSDDVLTSLPYLDQIRPALYNGELRFGDTSWPSMQPYPIEAGAGGTVAARPNAFLNSLYAGLRERGIEMMEQLEGAPKQWENTKAIKGSCHFPFPTDLQASASAMGKWAELYSGTPVTWTMWNEPSHNLTGKPSLESVRQIAEIYSSYTGAIAPHSLSGLFGLASFVPENAKPDKKLGGRSYLQAVMDELRKRPGLKLDRITMDNYGHPVHSVIDGARDALGTDFNTVSLMQAQFGVYTPNTWNKGGRDSDEAARSVDALSQALEIPDLQVFTFSGWIPHMIDLKGGQAEQMPLFNALKLYARMPDLRAPVQGSLPSGVGAMASGDENRASVMVWNTTTSPKTVTLGLSGLQASGPVSVYHIDAGHGSPKENGSGPFVPVQAGRVSPGSGKLSQSVTVAGPGIAYVEIGGASRHPVLDRGGLPATLIRKHSYADRVPAGGGKTAVRGSAYGSYDAVRALAYLGIKGAHGTALTGAEYRGLPATLTADIWADLPAAPSSSREALLGVRVDYVLSQGGAAKSVLWHGDIFGGDRTGPLPWGRGGPAADVRVAAPALNRVATGQRTLTLDLGSYAPPGWAGAGRQAIISFWMVSAGPRSQVRFLLS